MNEDRENYLSQRTYLQQEIERSTMADNGYENRYCMLPETKRDRDVALQIALLNMDVVDGKIDLERARDFVEIRRFLIED